MEKKPWRQLPSKSTDIYVLGMTIYEASVPQYYSLSIETKGRVNRLPYGVGHSTTSQLMLFTCTLLMEVDLSAQWEHFERIMEATGPIVV